MTKIRGSKPAYDGVPPNVVGALLRHLIDYSPEYVALLTPDGRVIKINRRPADSLQEAEVLGRYLWDTPWWTHAPDQQEQLRVAVKSAWEGRCTTFEVVPAMIKRPLYLEMSVKPVKDATRKVVLLLAEGRDITERKQAENALRESEWKFRAIFNQNFQLTGILDLDGTVLEANKTSLTLGGIDESEVKGKPFWETPWWSHSKDLQNQLRAAIKKCATGDPVAFEVTHPAPDGSLHFLDFSIKPLRDAVGNVVFLIPEARDITDQKRAEKAASEAAAKYRIIADNTYSWEVWISPEGKYIYSSPSCRRITGHAAEEFTDNPDLLKTLVHPDDMEAWNAHRQRAVTSKALQEIEFRLLRDGDIAWIHHVCTPICDVSGIFLGTRGNFEDITKRKQAEEKNLQLASVVESSDDAIFGKTVDGVITSWNRGAEKIFGYKEEEVIGKSVTLLFPPEREEEVLNIHGRIRRGEHIEHYETVSRKKDGELLDMSFTYSPIKDAQGTVVAISVTGRDITALNKTAAALLENERIKRELELQEKELLLLRQSRLAAMGELIGNIAHQWRQPLNMLGLCAQELCMTFEAGAFTSEYLETCVKKMMKIINHMSRTIDDFRDFTRPDREKMNFGVLEVIQKTISLQQSTMDLEQIKVQLVASCAPVVNGYPNEFSQVILNIMINAKDALLARNVTNPTIKIELVTEDDSCVVTITDNAGGIPEEIMEKIFDPYFTTKGPDKGTGIGLYMSKRIMENNMGGTLTARNVDGGAEFRIVV